MKKLIPRQDTMNRRTLLFGATGAVVCASHDNIATATATVQDDTRASLSPEAIVDTAIEGDSDAVALVESAALSMDNLESYRYSLRSIRDNLMIFGRYELKAVEGAVLRPQGFEASITVRLLDIDLHLRALGRDGEFWIQDPLSGPDNGMTLSRDSRLPMVINPDVLILASLRFMKDAHSLGESTTMDGETHRRVGGKVDFAESASMSSVSPEHSRYAASGRAVFNIGIDKANRVVNGQIKGPLLSSGSEDFVLDVAFSDFDTPVVIEPPVR